MRGYLSFGSTAATIWASEPDQAVDDCCQESLRTSHRSSYCLLEVALHRVARVTLAPQPRGSSIPTRRQPTMISMRKGVVAAAMGASALTGGLLGITVLAPSSGSAATSTTTAASGTTT